MSVYIGNDPNPFTLHKNLVCATSGLFRRYRQERDALTLPNLDARLFELYAEWLYANHSKTVLKQLKAHKVVRAADGTTDTPGAAALYELFELGESLLDAKFKNTVVDAYIDATSKATEIPTHFAVHIYGRLPRNSTFRRLYVDLWAWNADKAWFEDLEPRDDPLTAPGEFWLDVAKRMAEMGKPRYEPRARPPWVVDRGQYHESEEQPVDEEDEDESMEVVTKPDPGDE